MCSHVFVNTPGRNAFISERNLYFNEKLSNIKRTSRIFSSHVRMSSVMNTGQTRDLKAGHYCDQEDPHVVIDRDRCLFAIDASICIHIFHNNVDRQVTSHHICISA